MRWIAGPALAWVVVLACGCGGHVLPEIRSDADRISVARKLIAEDDCTNAIELLKNYTASSGGAADVDQAIYLLGSCYLSQHDWALAAVEFERLLRDYPESDSSAAAAFSLGEAYFGQARKPDFDQEYTVKALDQWQRYVQGYPDHWRKAEGERRVLAARNRLAQKLVGTGKLYLKLKLLEPARVYFRRVLDEYGDTPAANQARLGLALVDAREGKRAEAVAALRAIEAEFAGQPVAERAAQERKRLER
jgi:outer membrane protein assembly factor BamD